MARSDQIHRLSSRNKRTQTLKEKREDKKTCDSLYLILGHIMSFRSAKFTLIFVLLGIQFFLFIKDYQIYRPANRKTILLFMVNILFILVIIIFVFVAKSMGHRINQMQYAFSDNKNYRNYVQAYYEWISISRKKYRGHYQLKRMFFIGYRTLFFVSWLGVTGIFIWYAWHDLSIVNHRLGIYTIILYSISMVLMGYTSLSTFAYIFFLYNLSSTDNHRKLQRYHYNKRMPQETSGFVQIKSDINIHAVCYMAVSLLYSLALPLLVSLDKKAPFRGFYYHNSIEFYLVTILFSALCVMGSVLVFPMPMIMLNRIISLWNNCTIQSYENEIDGIQEHMKNVLTLDANQYRNLESRLDYLEKQIEHIRKKKSLLKNNTLPVLLTVLEFMSPLLSFAVTVIT